MNTTAPTNDTIEIDFLREKIAEFERQLSLDKAAAVDEINEQIEHLLGLPQDEREKLIKSRVASLAAFRDIKADLEEFQLQMDLAKMEATNEFENQRTKILGSISKLDGIYHQLEKTEDALGITELTVLRKRNATLANKIETLHLHLNLSNDGKEKEQVRDTLEETKQWLATLPAEFRRDTKHLGHTLSEVSRSLFDAFKVFFMYHPNGNIDDDTQPKP